MKILIFTYEFPPFTGGAGVYSYDLGSGLASLGVEVHVATCFHSQQGGDENVHGLYQGLNMHFMSKWQFDQNIAHSVLCRLHLKHQFDAVIVSDRYAQEIVATMPPCGMPLVAIIHGTEILDYFGRENIQLNVPSAEMAAFYRSVGVCIAVSKATLALACNLLKENASHFVAVQNGINLKRLAPCEKETVEEFRRNYGDDPEIVFSLARLDLDKGQDILIKAFRKIHQERSSARLVIGGDGPYRSHLEALVKSFHLEGVVSFVGKIPQTKLPSYFAGCDVFALPSRSEKRWEGFGLVYLEAGFYEKSVVGGNEGGVPEAIDDGDSGLIVDPRDEDAVASAIIRLLEDEKLRREMGKTGKRRVLDYFNSQRMAEETLNAIQSKGRQKKVLKSRLLWVAAFSFLKVINRTNLRRIFKRISKRWWL